MRNLKKILALVLALIMSLSLMATAGATDFKDDESITETYRQSIEVLTDLGVFTGDQNGDLKPEANITRAEAAALIYRVTTGDVTNERDKTYGTYNQFKDVQDEDWFAGYVTYCANAGYIKGRGDGTFDPYANVTGYEVLAMILRAVGYDKNNEFIGDNWQTRTAQIATEQKIVRNITSAVSLNAAATREVVGELLFQSILVPTVTWNAGTLGYTFNDTTLSKEYLDMEAVTGVVMANEYADLEGDEPLAAGKTRLDVDGVPYTLDISSELTDIGEIRSAFVVKNEVLTGGLMNPGESNVAQAENGKGSKVADVARQGNMKIGSGTEFFVNFGDAADGYTSDSRIEYVLYLTNQTLYDAYQLVYENGGQVKNVKMKGPENNRVPDMTGTAPNLAYQYEATFNNATFGLINDKVVRDHRWSVNPIAAYDGSDYVNEMIEYRKVITVGEALSIMDMQNIRTVFYRSSDVNGQTNVGVYDGEIYIGTQTATDWSDTAGNTYAKFVEDFVGADKDYTSSDNGEWLKVIDNNGDGVADYVLRTDFVMTTVTAYNKQAKTYSTEYLNITGSNEIPEDAIVYVGDLEKLSVGQVILYTLIDGVYYVQEPETETVTFDAINVKAGTCTAGDVDYVWSGINYKAASYFSVVEDAAKNVNYKLYKDAFGYVRLYNEATKFLLLTDGYFYTNIRQNTWKAEAFIDGELQVIDAVDTGFTKLNENFGFINPLENADTTQSNRDTWHRLNGFDYYCYSSKADTNFWNGNEEFATNVASVVMGENDIYNLYDVEHNNNNHTAYHSYEITSRLADGVTLLGAVTWNNRAAANQTASTTRTIKTNSSTVYYLVEVKDNVVTKVTSPETLPAAKEYNRAYAITSVVTTDTTAAYETAEVVVCEKVVTASADKRPYFALAVIENGRPNYAQPVQSRARAALNGGNTTHIYALGYNTVTETYEITDTWVELDGTLRADGLFTWYTAGTSKNPGEYIAPAKYEEYGIHGGVVSTLNGTNDRYVQFSFGVSERTSDTPNEQHYASETNIFEQNSIPVYTIENIQGTVNGFTAYLDTARLVRTEKVLYLTAPNSKDVVMAINITQSDKSINLADKDAAFLTDAWKLAQVEDDRPSTFTYTFFGENRNTVTYKEAKDWLVKNPDKAAITASNGITSLICGGKDIKNSIKNLTANPSEDVVYTLISGSEVITLTQQKGKSDAKVLDTSTTVKSIVETYAPDGCAFEPVGDPLISQFEAGIKVSEGATVKFVYQNSAGVLTDADMTGVNLKELYKVQIIVTAEDENTTWTYTWENSEVTGSVAKYNITVKGYGLTGKVRLYVAGETEGRAPIVVEGDPSTYTWYDIYEDTSVTLEVDVDGTLQRPTGGPLSMNSTDGRKYTFTVEESIEYEFQNAPPKTADLYILLGWTKDASTDIGGTSVNHAENVKFNLSENSGAANHLDSDGSTVIGLKFAGAKVTTTTKDSASDWHEVKVWVKDGYKPVADSGSDGFMTTPEKGENADNGYYPWTFKAANTSTGTMVFLKLAAEDAG